MAANLGVKARGGPGLRNVAYLWECVRGDTYGIWIPTAWVVDSSYKKTERSGSREKKEHWGTKFARPGVVPCRCSPSKQIKTNTLPSIDNRAGVVDNRGGAAARERQLARALLRSAAYRCNEKLHHARHCH